MQSREAVMALLLAAWVMSSPRLGAVARGAPYMPMLTNVDIFRVKFVKIIKYQ